MPSNAAPSSPKLVEVSFKHRRRRLFNNKLGFNLMGGDDIIVGVGGGLDFGHVTLTGEMAQMRAKKGTRYNRVVRRATDHDVRRHEENRAMEREALEVFEASIKKHKVPIKAVDAEWQHDRKRLSLYYSDSKKPSVGVLIKDLARKFKTTIDIRRLSPRHEAAHMGGIGDCGRELCCSTWMQTPPKVLFSYAETQQLPLGGESLKGRCGQLKCCLSYELDHYVNALKEFPQVGKHVSVTLPEGNATEGRVTKVDIFGRTVTIRHEDRRLITADLEQVQVPGQKHKG